MPLLIFFSFCIYFLSFIFSSNEWPRYIFLSISNLFWIFCPELYLFCHSIWRVFLCLSCIWANGQHSDLFHSMNISSLLECIWSNNDFTIKIMTRKTWLVFIDSSSDLRNFGNIILITLSRLHFVLYTPIFQLSPVIISFILLY